MKEKHRRVEELTTTSLECFPWAGKEQRRLAAWGGEEERRRDPELRGSCGKGSDTRVKMRKYVRCGAKALYRGRGRSPTQSIPSKSGLVSSCGLLFTRGWRMKMGGERVAAMWGRVSASQGRGVPVARVEKWGEEARLLPGLGWLAAAGGEGKARGWLAASGPRARGKKEQAGLPAALAGPFPFFFVQTLFCFLFQNIFPNNILCKNK